jgi:hypothetical protein
MKWDDNNWAGVTLSLAWAYSEQDIVISFDDVAHLMGNRFTATALQQALLELRTKKVFGGLDIPLLRMR